jgi:hypothetical protein
MASTKDNETGKMLPLFFYKKMGFELDSGKLLEK